MSFVVKDRVKETTTTTGTGTLTLAGAVSGFRSFGDIGNGNTTVYVILEASESAPTAWEVGIGTYTSSGTTLSRDTVLRTSAGNTTKITLASGTHTVFCGWSADYALGSDFAQHAIIPGGRLTLTSGTPVTTSDVTGATSIYYTPYVSNVISLWTGARWQPIEFSEYTLALGTLTSGKPYDVFAYLSSGALACEVLAWTNDTTRATAITLQDGRYCKSGDKTRLYLGTFYTTSTTTTEDSKTKRLLFNTYNRVARRIRVSESTVSWTYNSSTFRYVNNNSANRVEIIKGLDEVPDSLTLNHFFGGNTAGVSSFGIGLDTTASDSVVGSGGYGSHARSNVAAGNDSNYCAAAEFSPGIGWHYYAWIEAVLGGQTNTHYGNYESGISGRALA